MTEVRPDIDLSQLKRAAPVSSQPPPRRWLRIVVPLAILLAFGGILASSLGDLFGKTVEITVVRPKPATDAAEIAAGLGAVALQAAGWAEPDPFPILVPALTSGVLAEVLVQESDEVRKGDPVARMIDDEARIGVERATAALAEAQAEHARAQAEKTIAGESFEAALAVTENAAVMRLDAAGKSSESRRRIAAVAGREAQLEIAKDELRVQQELARGGAAGPRAVEIAQSRVKLAESELEVARAEAARAGSDAVQAATRSHRADRELELRHDERLRRETARAGLELAEASVRSAEAARKDAALRLDRMTIRSPATGVVMERLAAPGRFVQADDPERAVVCSLFDPAHLRIRVDVSQSDVSKVSVGQAAQILSQARNQKPYRGEVIRVVQRADIQKVTLQVHVRVLDGDGLLRPEMLCQVKLLAPKGAESAPAATTSPAVLVPARLVADDRFVWAVDAEVPRARRRSIEVGGRSGDWVLVRSGLNLTDKLIDGGREQLEEGIRVRIRKEQ